MSMYTTEAEFGMRSERALIAEGSRLMSRIRLAVAMASRGGTMERMISVAPRNEASVSWPVMEVDEMRDSVDFERPALLVVTV